MRITIIIIVAFISGALVQNALYKKQLSDTIKYCAKRETSHQCNKYQERTSTEYICNKYACFLEYK